MKTKAKKVTAAAFNFLFEEPEGLPFWSLDMAVKVAKLNGKAGQAIELKGKGTGRKEHVWFF